ncbi:STAS domain-containing protein [Pleionea mediterranea]|jgi:ABC-type transporter Mla MlaB component|uniref:STAS domain-containing protein n=1 Tax=Pleionea mediterranea TaxID=523701 RepID=A0A316FLV7_9GAMM|nr:STAS domain-containing protein [Pleionea mediterranea]
MENKVSVSCGSQVTIQQAEALKQRFLNALNKQSNLCYVNASKVEKLDTAGAQLLYAFIRQAETMSIEVRWQHPSSALLADAKLLGMQQALQLNNL